MKADQAQGLRDHHSQKPVKVIAVTGGKGGVGKTNISVNMAIALANRGQKVMLFDADLGLANVDVMLGLHPTKNLSQVMRGECDLKEIVLEGPCGIKIVPAASGIREMADMGMNAHAGIIQSFSDIGRDIDTLIVDTAAGISDSVISFIQASQHVLVVVCDEPTSITDAYAMIKILNREHGVRHFNIVSNMVANAVEGKTLFNKLSVVTDKFLDVILDYTGFVPFDTAVRKAVKKQNPIMTLFPESQAAREINKLAQQVSCLPAPKGAHSGISFFIERMISQEQVAG